MRWLKEKIKQWLIKEVLKEEIQKLNQAQACYNRASCLCEESLENNREMQKMFNEITDVAVDVNMGRNEHSWAVVCIAGKPEYVKFIPLNRNDARSVIDFLNQFQYSKHIVDSPIKFRHMLNDYFLK
jgi:hypothetical protein